MGGGTWTGAEACFKPLHHRALNANAAWQDGRCEGGSRGVGGSVREPPEAGTEAGVRGPDQLLLASP